ncbi:MAG: hypothetical protein WBB45_06910 [Cyclobacteriaceae bacterium]
MKRLPVLLLIAMIAFSCLSEEEDFAGFTSGQVERLVTADSLKAWQISSVLNDGELLPLTGTDSCIYQYRYHFTSFIGNDSTTVYLRNDPAFTCQADTIAFFWTTLFEEEEEDLAVIFPRLIVGTDSGNIITRLTLLTDSQMEWQLLSEDQETPADPELYIRFTSITD